MARFMIIQSFPFERRKEFGKVYLEIYKDFPAYIKFIGNSPYITTNKEEVNIYTIIQIEDEKTGSSLKELTNYFNKFNIIENYSWEVHTLVKRREALKLAGISLEEITESLNDN